MVVPDSTVPQPHSGSASCLLEAPGSSCKGAEVEGQDLELEEVRKLQELVRRLEVQNETLRNRGTKLIRGASDHTANVQERLAGNGVQSSHPSLEDRDDSSGDEMTLPVVSQIDEEDDDDDEEERGPCTGFLTLSCGGRVGQGQSQTPDSPSQESYESETLADSDSGVDQTALDEVDVLDLEEESADVDEGDSWLYVSPKKQMANAGPESPLKWCRQVLDHPSPDTEVACRTLINRLDQTARWRSMYSSPSAETGSAGSGLISPGYHKSTNKSVLTSGNSGTSVHSTLSSQSSIDSELSTSDDSISMGYKLQDLTDVQIMARLQEESLRQDYASSSASASRRSSTTSLHSLRRCGNCSDQEFDSYSLEDEDEFCSLPPRQHRFTPSPLGSPRCQSPSTSNHGPEHSSRLGASRTRTPRRSLQGPSAELIKFARSEEELRHSMPNLAPRTSLRSLEAVRNSRSMEANLQSSGNRMSHLSNPPSTGVTNGRIRSNGQSPLSLRTPVKAVGPMSGNHSRGLPVIQCPPAGRRVQSPSSGNGGPYVPGRTSIGTTRAGMGRGPNTASASSRSKFPQTPRRSFGISKMSDESWKDGCY
ncbi:SLAIN motif-containing protein-like isoform X1 [Eucyclogobius newberryi]|uniref:SLAIN motif-containing protein-like isoform X1 n=1 Tax=Eucyclogobius newberryi TaxID=166745 RepID=UPI003B58C85A